MPRINNPDEIAELIPKNADNRLSLRDRLMKRFAAHEWVRVINVDDEPYIWQYLPAHAEDFEFTPDPMKITRRGDVEIYRLDPGESEVIIGENAYLMIEGLYKKIISKKVIAERPDTQPGLARSFNWTDANLQEYWLDRIFLGKEKISFDISKEEMKQHELPEQPQAAGASGRLRKTL